VVNWEKAPWSLRAYVILSLASSLIVAIVASSPILPRVFLVGFTIVICFFLLKGVRWLWILSIAFIPLGFAMAVAQGNVRWYSVALGVVDLILLIHPDTRRVFRREEIPVAT
jgi:hypothetical protein